jgi:hypothetical protein
MDFGKAIEALKKGESVSRKGWNGKGMFLYLDSFEKTNSNVNEPGYKYEPCIVMFTADEKWQPGWLASQTDMLAEDWIIV